MAVRLELVHGAPAQDLPGARPLQVLLIEDSPLIREAVAELVESGGHACITAAVDNETDAIAELRSHAYEVVIVDLKLRAGTGFGVLRMLQESHADTLVIVFTNFATPAIRKRCAELGATWFFDKSRDFEAIGELISRHAAQRGLS
ncbi:MAG: response regulator [Betaproteobacteria bacterium]|nr:MAG: response regulator [Betaproteobacteria bacterium]